MTSPERKPRERFTGGRPNELHKSQGEAATSRRSIDFDRTNHHGARGVA